jgi:hypothetical protein
MKYSTKIAAKRKSENINSSTAFAVNNFNMFHYLYIHKSKIHEYHPYFNSPPGLHIH